MQAGRQTHGFDGAVFIDLERADCRHAIFVDADLSRANFTSAMVRNANLTNAQKWGARGLEDVI